MNKLIWPLLILIGFLFVLVFDVASGFSSPGFWLVPIGIAGTLIATSQKTHGSNTNQLNSRTMWLIGVWFLAFLSFAGLYLGWFTEGLETLIWLFPMLGFSLIGLVLSVVFLARK